MLSLASVCLPTESIGLNDIAIEYVVENNLITAGKARYRINETKDTTYKLSFETEPSGLFRLTRKGRIRETAEVSVKDTLVRPHVYTHANFSQPERSFQIEFDHANSLGKVTAGEATSTIVYPAATVDRLSMILSLTLRLLYDPDFDGFSIPLLEKNNVRTVHFEMLESELIQTQAGTFDTVVMKKSRTGSNKHEVIWFATLGNDNNYYPIQFEQYKQNSLVVRLTLDGYQITP